MLDLGLVRAVDSGPSLTTAGVVVGTPHYTSARTGRGLPVDGRADLFSLGCVLYTTLSGELAFAGDSTMAVLMAAGESHPATADDGKSRSTPELSAAR